MNTHLNHIYIITPSSGGGGKGRSSFIKSGKYKAAGFPGVALDEEVRKHLQLEVMETYNEFAGFVKKYRADLNYEYLQGQTLTGRKAAEVGMVDGTAKNLDSLLQKLGKA